MTQEFYICFKIGKERINMLQYLKSFTFEDTLNQTISLEQYAPTQRISS